MTYRRLTDLADVLRDAGLDVEEIDGWKTRGRPASTGGFSPVGNLWHHTGGAPDTRAYADWMAREGRADLPAPLCHVAVTRGGRMIVSAAGRANHAGKARAAGPVPAGDGNALYAGWECMNTGSEGWTKDQYRAMVVAAAATSLHYGWSAQANRAHRETSTTGKWDPGQLDMDRFRADIAREMDRQVAAAQERARIKARIGRLTKKINVTTPSPLRRLRRARRRALRERLAKLS